MMMIINKNRSMFLFVFHLLLSFMSHMMHVVDLQKSEYTLFIKINYLHVSLLRSIKFIKAMNSLNCIH